MNKKYILLFCTLFLIFLSGIFGFVSARGFNIFNSSNPFQNYFSINGTTGYGYFGGNVGIGTTGPRDNLEIYDGSGDAHQIITTPNTAGDTYITFNLQGITNWHVGGDRADGGKFKIGSSSIATHDVSTGTKLTIDQTGNVGIGTTSPSGRLHITQDTGQSSGLVIDAIGTQNPNFNFAESGTNKWNFGYDLTGNYFKIAESGVADRFVIKEITGNVGIGTVSPSYKLDVAGDIYTSGDIITGGTISQQCNSATISSPGWYRIASNTGDRADAIFTLTDTISGGGHSTVRMIAGTNFNNRGDNGITVLSNTYFGTATFTQARLLTNTTYDAQYLEVYVQRTGGVEFCVSDNHQSSGWTPVNWTAGSVPTGYTSQVYTLGERFYVGQNGDSESLSMDFAGNVGIGTVSPSYNLDVSGTGRFTSSLYASAFYYTSDRRLKTNITQLDVKTSLDKINKLRGVSFNWKNSSIGNLTQIGFIAQDVEKIFPEVVSTNSEGYKSVQYGNLVAPLVGAVQELSNQTTSINFSVSKLTVENEKLRKENEKLNEKVREMSVTLEKVCSNNPKLCE